MKKAKKVFSIIGNTILWLFVLFSVVITVLVFSAQSNKDGLANIAGKSMITVLTDSMKPTFKSGDLIFDKILTNEEKIGCEVGDVITYYTDLNGDGNDEINTHRIVERYDEDGYTYYITKGDNNDTNPVNDATPVVSNKVLGKYTEFKLSGMGSVISFLQTSMGFLCVVVLPLVIFFLFELYNFIITITKAKMKNASATDEEEIKRRAIEEYLKQQADAGVAVSGEPVPGVEASANVSESTSTATAEGTSAAPEAATAPESGEASK